EDDDFWLALLAETGADRLLTGESGPEDGSAEAADGPVDRAGGPVDAADWLSRWALHRKRGSLAAVRSRTTLSLVERMAARLREQGRPVDLFTGRWRPSADLDLLDLCAAHGIPLTLPESAEDLHDDCLPVKQWLTDTRPGRRDLTAVAADAGCRRLLYRAVGTVCGHRHDTSTLEELAAHPVLADVLREWLEDAAGELAAATGLPAARTALER
ncbi:hypothetical protein GTY23_05910, partial [Streptomyces sp. SID5998]|nr:hypothetical protein [Streptomyces sp. SID5998]